MSSQSDTDELSMRATNGETSARAGMKAVGAMGSALIRGDAIGDNIGDDTGAIAVGMPITAESAEQPYTGANDVDEILRDGSAKRHAKLVDLTMADHFWDMLMDLEGDGNPDDVLSPVVV